MKESKLWNEIINSIEKCSGQPSLSLTALLEIECVGFEWLIVFCFLSLFFPLFFFCFLFFLFLFVLFFLCTCTLFFKRPCGCFNGVLQVLVRERAMLGMMICARSLLDCVLIVGFLLIRLQSSYQITLISLVAIYFPLLVGCCYLFLVWFLIKWTIFKVRRTINIKMVRVLFVLFLVLYFTTLWSIVHIIILWLIVWHQFIWRLGLVTIIWIAKLTIRLFGFFLWILYFSFWIFINVFVFGFCFFLVLGYFCPCVSLNPLSLSRRLNTHFICVSVSWRAVWLAVFLVTIVSLRETGVFDNKNNNFIKISFIFLRPCLFFCSWVFCFCFWQEFQCRMAGFLHVGLHSSLGGVNLTGNSLCGNGLMYKPSGMKAFALRSKRVWFG